MTTNSRINRDRNSFSLLLVIPTIIGIVLGGLPNFQKKALAVCPTLTAQPQFPQPQIQQIPQVTIPQLPQPQILQIPQPTIQQLAQPQVPQIPQITIQQLPQPQIVPPPQITIPQIPTPPVIQAPPLCG